MSGVKLGAAEKIIGDLLDEGLSISQIIRREPGIDPATVRRVAGYIGRGQADLWMRDARAASYALLCAIRRHHPEQVRA